MRAIISSTVIALGLAGSGTGPASAQTAPPTKPAPASPAPVLPASPAAPAAGAPSAAAQDAAAVKQMLLTPALVDQFIAAKTEIDAVLEKLPDGIDQPDPATMVKLDAAARKFKFDDYKQYDMVENNIGIVMSGIDAMTKQYIGPEAVVKKQIAAIEADKQISAKDRKDTIDQLTTALQTIPKLQFPANISVVVTRFDKLNESMPQD